MENLSFDNINTIICFIKHVEDYVRFMSTCILLYKHSRTNSICKRNMKRFKKLQFYLEETPESHNFIFKIRTPKVFVSCVYGDWISKEDSLKLLNNTRCKIIDGVNRYSMIKIRKGFVYFYSNILGPYGDCACTMILKYEDCADAFREFYNSFFHKNITVFFSL